MIDIQTLTLLPQDQLALVNGIEIQAIQRYRWLALRFLTYSTTLSRQMAELGITCEQRLVSWRETAECLGLSACVDHPKELRGRVARATPHDRFFVIDVALVDQTLQQALAACLETQSQARRLLGTNGTPELERPLREYAYHKQLETGIMIRCCEAHQQRI